MHHVDLCKQMISIILDSITLEIKLLMLNSNTWNHLTVGKHMINIKYVY